MISKTLERKKTDFLRDIHSKTLKIISIITFKSCLNKNLSTNLIRNYKSILSIIEKEKEK